MKVTVYDENGAPIGIAWHENDEGTIQLPPATRPIIAAYFTVNDGPMLELSHAVLMPVDTDFQMTVSTPSSRRKLVDKPATKVTLWARVKEALTWIW